LRAESSITGVSWALTRVAQAPSGVELLALCLGLVISLVWSRYRHGSWAWGLVVWAYAVAASVATLCTLVPRPFAQELQAVIPKGGLLLAGFLVVQWSLLGAGLAERYGQGRGLSSLQRTGLIFAVGVVAVSVGWLIHEGAPASGLARRELTAAPMILVLLWGFSVLVKVMRAPPGSRPVCGWTMLNSLCGYGVFASGCAQAPVLALIALLCGKRRLPVMRGCTRIWMRLVYAFTPTVRWRFRGDIDALNGRKIVVANHESMLDILSASALPGVRNLLAKTWVFRAPFLGLGARFAGIHNVDELSVDAYLEHADRLLGTQEGLFIFPEGRRSRSGLLGRFHLGAFHLAIATRAPVVPVAMCGSSWSLPPQLIWIHPGELHALVLRPMHRLGQESARAFSERVRQVLAREVIQGRKPLLTRACNRLNRRGWQFGRPPAQRRAAAREDLAVQAVLCAVASPGAWLQLGAGSGAACVIMRQLVPAAVVTVVEPSRLRRAYLAAAGVPPERLVAEMPEMPARGSVLVLWQDPVLVCAALTTLRPSQLVVVPSDLVEAVQVVLRYVSAGQSWSVEAHGAYSVLRHPQAREALEGDGAGAEDGARGSVERDDREDDLRGSSGPSAR
jgi:1-acyl-sn-glycerol-3-phosphate acyltransferase